MVSFWISQHPGPDLLHLPPLLWRSDIFHIQPFHILAPDSHARGWAAATSFNIRDTQEERV